MYDIPSILSALGAAITIGMGLMGLLVPTAASRLTGLTAQSKTAFAEFRGTFGAMFIALGLVPLLTGAPAAYAVAAGAWLASGLGRFVSIVWDGGHKEPKNFGAAVLELAIGGLLLAGA
jgi:hypothetical protein